MTPAQALPAIVRALGGRRSGRGFSCHCPIHSDRDPSLTVSIGRSGRIVLHCFAACDPLLVIANLRARGLWSDEKADAGTLARSRADAESYQRRRLLARVIWSETVPLSGSPGEDYLCRIRAIGLDPGPNIRWHWREFGLVAKIVHPLSDDARGVQITRIDRYTHTRTGGITCEIRDKRDAATWFLKRRPDLERSTIGAGGVVKLGAVPDRSLLLGEGVESTLSAMMLHRAPCGWASLGAGALGQLARGGVPLGINLIGLLVDRDKAGEDACAKAAAGIRAQDFRREVRLLRPPDGFGDWNDYARALAAGAAREESHAAA